MISLRVAWWLCTLIDSLMVTAVGQSLHPCTCHLSDSFIRCSVCRYMIRCYWTDLFTVLCNMRRRDDLSVRSFVVNCWMQVQQLPKFLNCYASCFIFFSVRARRNEYIWRRSGQNVQGRPAVHPGVYGGHVPQNVEYRCPLPKVSACQCAVAHIVV